MKLRTQFAALSVIALLTSASAQAEAARVSLRDWTWPPAIVCALILTAALYSTGLAKMFRHGADRKLHVQPMVYFVVGWASLVIALDSPIHELGEQLFWVHMTQHEILMLVSAPLLVLSRPLVPFLWALPDSIRMKVVGVGRNRIVSSSWRLVSAPFGAWLLSALALWMWHAPALFDGTLHSEWIHAAQHSTFFLTALLFWWPLANRQFVLGYGGALVYVFTTALHTSILGALLTFAPRAWYASYLTSAPEWGISALEDQQIGGLIMWIPAGTLLLIVSLVLLVKWLKASDTRWEYTRMAALAHHSKGAGE
jgi:putative membrane protein